MHRTRIKICGVTRPEDAVAAARAGADAVGLVFHPAAGRYVSADAAKKIVAALPPFVSVVGLFVDADADVILSAARGLPLAAVQMHGRETPDAVAAVAPLPVIKAVRVDPETFGGELRHWREAVAGGRVPNLAGLVVETAHTQQPGGTGVANDWDALARHAARGDFRGLPPWIAAGGLTPLNVAGVVARLRPWAVDVSSGVEAAKREKSPELIAAFVRAVREADAGGESV